MRFLETNIVGAYIIELERREDHRGFFARAWCQEEVTAHGLNPCIAQINIGFSCHRGTLRGMHYQPSPHQEAKLVRCTMGAVCDVVVDLRPDSPTHKRWIAMELSAENRRTLYIPEGCAHGYQTLVDDTEIYYHTSRAYAPTFARGVRYNDTAFGITWPLPVSTISEADRSWPDYSPL